MNKYELTIGLEVHTTLQTKSKVFCSCKNDSSNEVEANVNTCEICLGMPGALPVLNEEVVKKALKVGELLNCKINKSSEFDRKHFANVDLVKNFQITQFRKPILEDGYLDVIMSNDMKNKKRVTIERVHIEEDAGKQVKKNNKILIDYNRSGMPLLEIVTTPCFKSSEEVRKFLEQLQMTLKYNEISKCKMNEGGFRFDVNVSIRLKGEKELGYGLGERCEFKNINSFTQCEKAIEEEYKRQVSIKEKGEEIKSMSLNWNEKTKTVEIVRPKEKEGEYEYLRETNLPMLNLKLEEISVKNVCDIESRIDYLMMEYKLSYEESVVLIKNKEIEKYYEEVVKGFKNKKEVYNYIIEEILCKKDKHIISVENIRELFSMLEKGEINNSIMKKVQNKVELSNNLLSSKEIVKMEGLKLLGKEEVEKIVIEVLESNEKIVKDYKGGKIKAIQSLTGKVMSESKGLADSKLTKNLLMEKLK